MEPYFNYITEIKTDPLDTNKDDRPPTRDVVFKFPKQEHDYVKRTASVRFHGRKDNRFCTTFPKIGNGDWEEEVPDYVDAESAIMTAWAYIERVHGHEAEKLSNWPYKIDI